MNKYADLMALLELEEKYLRGGDGSDLEALGDWYVIYGNEFWRDGCWHGIHFGKKYTLKPVRQILSFADGKPETYGRTEYIFRWEGER